ncbi:MAG: FAD-dependent oxidoreductase [Acidobacteriota bacterium]
MAPRQRIVVVGAGMVGAACAAELAGSVDLTVLDAAIPGGGATAACMGHVVVMDDSEAQFALTKHSQVLWDRKSFSDAVERDRCGTLWVAADDEELDAARAKCRYYRERDVEAEILGPRQLREAEPELRRDLVGALRIPGDSVVYPPAAVAQLLEEAAAASRRRGCGYELRTGVRVERVEARGADGATVSLAGGETLEVDGAVVASGLASLGLLPGAAPTLRIRPRKGHLVITDRRPGFSRHQLVELGYLKSAHGDDATSVAFNLQPRRTGQMLIGSSRQTDVATRESEPEVVGRMLRRAAHFLPRLGALNATRVWTGLRPATDDHLPYIGPIEPGGAVVLAAGHEGLGITTATGTAELVAHHLLGLETALDPSPYLPRRGAHSASVGGS